MKPYLYDAMHPILFGFVAIVFLAIGLRGILTKRPFLISQRWLLAVMFAAFIPAILGHLLMPSFGNFNFMNWLFPLVFGVILVMMCYQMRGYMAYSITDTSFREALVGVLQKLQLPYEESVSLIRLTSIEADLQVSVQAWVGTGLIKVKQRAHRAVLKEIVNAMNTHFRMSSAPTNLIACVFFLVMGVFAIALIVSMLFIRRNF